MEASGSGPQVVIFGISARERGGYVPNVAVQYLKVERRASGAVAVVSLNRPEVRNAFHPVMIEELRAVFAEDLNRDTKLRAVLLRGEGKSFCAGADLGWMQSMVNFTLTENQRDSESLFAMFAALRDCPVPLIGRVHGHVMGGALGLAAVCDIVAAEQQTLFCFSEVRLGLAPAVISPFVLEKMHPSHAHRYMLTAETFSAAEAKDVGLVHFRGDLAAVDDFVEKTLTMVTENGPEAVRATKRLLRLGAGRSEWDMIRAETTRVIAERRVSPEGQEGLRGFLEKRVPSWKVF
jgi:methylglutaconyl-CoA hydratase